MASFLMVRRTIMMASCSDLSVSSMNCSAPPRRIIVHVLAFKQPVNILYLQHHTQVTTVTHTHTSRTTQVSWYQKGKTNLDFTEARVSEWQWHQMGHMQVCTSLQTDNHTSTTSLSFFTGWMPFLPPNQQCRSTEVTTVTVDKSHITAALLQITLTISSMPRLLPSESSPSHSRHHHHWVASPLCEHRCVHDLSQQRTILRLTVRWCRPRVRCLRSSRIVCCQAWQGPQSNNGSLSPLQNPPPDSIT